MFRALGLLIILYGLSQFFSNSFHAFDGAATESLRLVELAAIQSQIEIQENF
jgi:hypothetical protein